MRLQEEGASLSVISPSKAGSVYRSKSGGLSASSDTAASDVDANQFDALVIPGGWAPDQLRRHESIKTLVRTMHAQHKIIGMICHAGWVGASAGIVRGYAATGSMAIKDDMENAGATWRDVAALRDRNLVWGRVVKDIPHFCRELVAAIANP